jgi:hypothetical protein
MPIGDMIACGMYGTANKVVHKLGYNASLSGTTAEDVWSQGGTYGFPLAATYPGAKMEVASDSAADKGTATAGTGARTVTIGYLDGSGVEKSETVTLNGATPVETVAEDIWRINSFRVASAGTGLAAAGTIQLRELDEAPVFSAITIGQTRARNMAYTVPAGKMLMIRELSISSAAASADKAFLVFTLRANCNNGVRTAVGLDYPLWEGVVAGTGWNIQLAEPIYVPALVDTHMIAVGHEASDAAAASCEWRGCLMDAP